MPRLLPLLVLQAVVLLATSAVLFLTGIAPMPVAAHLAFAVGLLPLMLAAMQHFIAVLTRSGAPSRGIAAMPLLAWLGGVGMVVSWPPFSLGAAALQAGAGLAFVAAIATLAFSLRRAAACLGSPHPGLHWYQAALVCLVLALTAVFAMAPLPAHYRELRLLHLHLNTLGLVGLTALGTLEVLVPTVLGRPDPGAAMRLRRGWMPALAAVLLLAGGSAWLPWIAQAAALVLLLGLLRSFGAWWRLAGDRLPACHHAAASLVLATLGLAGLIVVGALHGAGVLPAFAAVPGFVAAFLLPLVTGAASHLLPGWWRPGVQGTWHAAFRQRLSRHSALRASCFVVGGLAAAAGRGEGLWLVAAGILLFAAVLAKALAAVGDDGEMRPSR